MGRAVTLLTIDQFAHLVWSRVGVPYDADGLSAQHALVHVTRLMKDTNLEGIVATDEVYLAAAALASEHQG